MLEHVIINQRIYHRVAYEQALRDALSGSGAPRHQSAPESLLAGYQRGVKIAIPQSNEIKHTEEWMAEHGETVIILDRLVASKEAFSALLRRR